MSLHVYVGGASAEIERAEAFIRRVRAAGHFITFDWPAEIRKSGKANAGLGERERFDAWRACLDAVSDADVCVFLAPRDGKTTRGMWAEIGAAQAMGAVPVYVGHDDDSIVTSMCEVVADDDAAFAALEAR